jgi:hypothetical protein
MKGIIITLLFLTFYGSYLIFTQLLLADNNLIAIDGQLIYKDNILAYDSIAVNQKIKCAILTFKLREDKRLYTIKLNIDSVYQGFNALRGVELALENAGQIKVWIKKSEISVMKPKVFKLAADEKNIYDQTSKQGNNIKLYGMLTGLIVLFSCTYYLLKNYDGVLRRFKLLLSAKSPSSADKNFSSL